MVLDVSLSLSDVRSNGSDKTDADEMAEKIKALLWDDDQNASALKKALKLSSRDYPVFDFCMEAMLAAETVNAVKKGKAACYSLR